ncbi:MAG TPA: hypothetical protein VHL34_14295 [Rhizomicrobium sp.]|jgi:hypothetical protein|nr:hypothetical protein [Rhizomicrobium sp.]
MTDFEYLSVLISIVLGLGITNILGGLGAIVRNRHRTKLYAPLVTTLVLMFVVHVQTWWTMFGLRGIREWNILEFFVVLMQPTILYLASSMLVPDFSEAGEIDLRAQYHRERRWFFGTMFALICLSLVRPVVLSGRLTAIPDLIGHGVFLIAIAAGLATDSDRVHKFVSGFMLVFFIAYIATLFVQLN